MRKAVFLAIIFLAAAGAFAVCPQANLQVAGIQGDMTGACAGAIDFSSAQFSTIGSGSTGGSGAGNPGGTLKVTKYFDKSSPALMLACENGQHIPLVTLSYPSAQTPVTVKFKNVIVATVNESVNPTNEAVDFKYQSWEIVSGGGTHTTGNVLGSARASSLAVAVVGGDGKSQPASHLSLTVRPGGTTFNSVQLAPSTIAPRGGMAKGAPTESLNFNYGKIEFKSANGTADFHFAGGTVVNGNLRVSRANLAPTAAVLRR